MEQSSICLGQQGLTRYQRSNWLGGAHSVGVVWAMKQLFADLFELFLSLDLVSVAIGAGAGVVVALVFL